MPESDHQSAPMQAPNQSPRGEGSMMLGYVVAWGGWIASLFVTAVMIGLLSSSSRLNAVAGLFSLLPMVAYLALLVWGFRHGPRTGKGVLAMGLTVIGLIVLLVAACFGYFALQ
jgi:uncharacterized membrane protein (GlpM family)